MELHEIRTHHEKALLPSLTVDENTDKRNIYFDHPLEVIPDHPPLLRSTAYYDLTKLSSDLDLTKEVFRINLEEIEESLPFPKLTQEIQVASQIDSNFDSGKMKNFKASKKQKANKSFYSKRHQPERNDSIELKSIKSVSATNIDCMSISNNPQMDSKFKDEKSSLLFTSNTYERSIPIARKIRIWLFSCFGIRKAYN